jgi:hypothetical protein
METAPAAVAAIPSSAGLSGRRGRPQGRYASLTRWPAAPLDPTRGGLVLATTRGCPASEGSRPASRAVQRSCSGSRRSRRFGGQARSMAGNRHDPQKQGMTRRFAWSSGVGRGGIERRPSAFVRSVEAPRRTAIRTAKPVDGDRARATAADFRCSSAAVADVHRQAARSLQGRGRLGHPRASSHHRPRSRTGTSGHDDTARGQAFRTTKVRIHDLQSFQHHHTQTGPRQYRTGSK